MTRSLGDRANAQMVDRLIGQAALWSPALISAFRETPRHHFLDWIYQYDAKNESWHPVETQKGGVEQVRLVYSDRALITRLSKPGPDGRPAPISSSSQPSLMAQMLEDLQLKPGLRVLEIGAGTGYNAALLAHVVGPGHVWSVDVDREVLMDAAAHLRPYADRRVHLRHGDGRGGLAEEAPFDRIIVTAATGDLEWKWVQQLAPDGLLLAPLALAPGLAFVVRGCREQECFVGRLTRAAYFMPLRSEFESGESVAEGPRPAGPLQTMRAPWARWFDSRKRPRGWVGFIQSLAFFGWLRGLAVSYITSDDEQSIYGLCDPKSQDGAWLGPQRWQVTGTSGRDLAVSLWRAFLDAGGPWPTEFTLLAAPEAMPRPPEVQSHQRLGPRCRQIWQLREPRERLGGPI
jgi:protein-L-isoaspartate(D-aspartate) O-methyltransferase